jgi:protein-S-isoprenylcysteine O-methyltransferase Ste14
MNRMRLIFERQWLHAGLLALLVAGAVLAGRLDATRQGGLWGLGTSAWYWLALCLAVGHQVYVWFCWRVQLHGGLITRVFGRRGFGLYAAGFSILGISRVVAVFLVAVANQGTLTAPPLLLDIAAVSALIPALYLFYSVKRYFTATRAFGADHFDDRYRDKPFVRKGIFRFTRNGMYLYGFLILWVPALWWASVAALCAALFNHLYIWVHYVATEKPDMARIYSGRGSASAGETQRPEGG